MLKKSTPLYCLQINELCPESEDDGFDPFVVDGSRSGDPSGRPLKNGACLI